MIHFCVAESNIASPRFDYANGSSDISGTRRIVLSMLFLMRMVAMDSLYVAVFNTSLRDEPGADDCTLADLLPAQASLLFPCDRYERQAKLLSKDRPRQKEERTALNKIKI